MDKVNLPFFYQLGAQLNPLTKMVYEKEKRVDIIIAALGVRESVDFLLNWSGGLNVCLTSARSLITALDAVIKWWSTSKSEDREKESYSVDLKFQQVIDTTKIFETVLSEELATLSAYSASKKGIYSTSDLIEKSQNVFPPSLLVKLNKDVKQEVQEAGKCLAFDIPTASAFHMLRATEEVLHEYYIVLCKPKNECRLDSWAAYIASLHKLTDEGANTNVEIKNHIKKVLGLLQQIKDQDRNLIMHPEVVLNPDESFVLFEITKGAIMTMVERIPTPEVKDNYKALSGTSQS